MNIWAFSMEDCTKNSIASSLSSFEIVSVVLEAIAFFGILEQFSEMTSLICHYFGIESE